MKLRVLAWVFVALLLPFSLALAAPPAPGASQASFVATAPPQATLSTAAPLCPGTDVFSFLPQAQPDASLCGACSDTICAGRAPDSVCGTGFRCISQGLCGNVSTVLRCRCLII